MRATSRPGANPGNVLGARCSNADCLTTAGEPFGEGVVFGSAATVANIAGATTSNAFDPDFHAAYARLATGLTNLVQSRALQVLNRVMINF